MGQINKLFAPDDYRVNPGANANNVLQLEVPEVRPTIDLDPSNDPANESIQGTKAANGGNWDYFVAPLAAGTVIEKVYWIDASTGAVTVSMPKSADVNGAKLTTNSGNGAGNTVEFSEVTMFALVTTSTGNIILIELT